MQPGATIQPGNSPEPPKDADTDGSVSETPVPAPEPQQQAEVPPAEPKAAWHYTGNDSGTTAAATPPTTSAPVTWTASEYIAHNKGSSWYVMVIGVIIVISAVLYFITKDLASPLAVFGVGVAFVIFGARPPQTLEYSVDGTGVHIGQRFYPYNQFKSFSILQEDAVRSILLMPMQRLGLPITIHYDPQDEDKIIDVIGNHLPHEEREVAAIDKLMSKIRF